jgi:hypothetical protein
MMLDARAVGTLDAKAVVDGQVGAEVGLDMELAMQELEERVRRVGALERLAAVVLLGGSVRSSRLSQIIGRSVLDLPVDEKGTLLDFWRDQAGSVAQARGLRRLPVRVMVDRDALEPRVPVAQEHTIVSVERDPFDYRGTGGVLKDLSRDYADEDYILVANAAQLLMEELPVLVEALAERQADVSMIAHRDGVPAGLMLIRCAALRGIASAGFVDLKEQALPAIARSQRVDVVERQTPSGLPVRNLPDYVQALRRHYQRRQGRLEVEAFEEDWESTFSLVESGAMVASTARVHDSVVLKGAVVEAGAVVVRSVVGQSGFVSKGRMVVEEVVNSANGWGRNGRE